MASAIHIPDFNSARVIILHRPHQTTDAISRQLKAIGLEVDYSWPELSADAFAADFVFFDVDMGYDAQFPWKPGQAPMPMIALIGSEAPGRIEWAVYHAADTQLLKPVGDNGVYSALLIAYQNFIAHKSLGAKIEGMQSQLAQRQMIVQAVTMLISQGADERDAYDQLRQQAMKSRETIEQTAQRIVARFKKKKGDHVKFDRG